MDDPIKLKAAGQLPNITLKNLNNASIAPSQIEEFAEKENNGLNCLHPDTPDKELAETSPDEIHEIFQSVYNEELCESIHTMHRKWREQEATGRGSWPSKCHPQQYPHENFHATLLYIAHEPFLKHSSLNRNVSDSEWQDVVDARVWPTVENPVKSIQECKRTFVYGGEHVSTFDREQWRQRSEKQQNTTFNMFDMSTWLTLESLRRVGILFIEVFTGNEGSHNVHEIMKPIPGSTAGFAYFNNATCGDHVTSNIDSLLSYSLGRLTRLRTHEFGHNNNLQHEFRNPQSNHRSIMSYAGDNGPFQGFRLAQDPYYVNTPGNKVEDHSWPELRRYYGGEPAKPIEVKPPTPIPPIPIPPFPPQPGESFTWEVKDIKTQEEYLVIGIKQK